ncbi:MAG: LuxR C-terminal-related transcriptional regulator [Vicinamibacterales bacterium]
MLTLMGRGLTTREIAEQLKLSVKTVENHRHLKEKLGARNGRELTRRQPSRGRRAAQDSGPLPPPAPPRPRR